MMDFSTRLRSWLAGYPVKLPAEHNAAQYTADVIERVRAIERPSAAPVPRQTWRHLTWFAAVATAALIMVVTGRQLGHGPLGPSGGLAFHPALTNGETEAMAQEMAVLDAMVIAEAEPSADEEWIDETLLLMEQLGEDASADPTSDEDRLLEDLLQDEPNQPQASS